MRKLTLFLIVVFLCMVIAVPSHSVIKKVGQTGLQFLKIDVGARAAAMGGAFFMVGTDADALFYNPAGIAYMSSKYDIFVSRTEWIANIKYNAAGIVASLGNWGNFGISVLSSDYGDIKGTRYSSADIGYVDTGLLDVNAYAIGLAYARRMTDKFTMGGQVKYTKQHLGDNLFPGNKTVNNEVSSAAYDFGTMFYPGFRSLRIGMSVRNFAPQVVYQQETFELPLTFMVSAAIDALDLINEEHRHSFLIALDALHPRDYTERLHLGGEFWYK